jgi:cbb3-type cytochrome oxidase subunit 3
MMGLSAWAYLGFTIGLFLAFAWIVIFYYAPKRKNRVERPKYTILEDDEPIEEEASDEGKQRHTGKRP